MIPLRYDTAALPLMSKNYEMKNTYLYFTVFLKYSNSIKILVLFIILFYISLILQVGKQTIG